MRSNWYISSCTLTPLLEQWETAAQNHTAIIATLLAQTEHLFPEQAHPIIEVLDLVRSRAGLELVHIPKRVPAGSLSTIAMDAACRFASNLQTRNWFLRGFVAALGIHDALQVREEAVSCSMWILLD